VSLPPTIEMKFLMSHRKLCLILLLLMLIPACELIASDKPDAIVSLTDTRLRVHAAPALDSPTVTFLDPAAPVKIIGRTMDKEWIQVHSADESEGWVVSEFMLVTIDLSPVSITTDLRALERNDALPPQVVDNVRQIFKHGQELGNRPNVFSKVGDSITESPHYLHPIGKGLYNLGDFQYLQGVINYFSVETARTANSFDEVSLAAGTGWSSDAVISPEFADPTLCQSGETPLACEYRIVRPSVALIMYGTNDSGIFDPITYEYKLQQIIEYSIAQGVIPVLSTIPIRLGYEDKVARFNQVVVKNTTRYNIPLWDFGTPMNGLPNFGLDTDGVHPSIPAGGIKGAGDFRAANLYSGYVIRNLTALQMLDQVWKAIR
jgi:SH3 domain-containing protein